MRVLWVKMGGLWPLNTGGRQRSFHMLSELSRRHQVDVITTHSPGDDPAGLKAELPRARSVVSIPYAVPKRGTAGFAGALARSWASSLPVDLLKWRTRSVQQAVRDVLARNRVDVVVADFLFAVPNVPRSRVPVVYFAHNVEHMIWKRLRDVETGSLRRLLLEIEWRKIRRAEYRTCRRATMSVAVSDDDRKRLADGSRSTRVVSVPTGVDTAFFRPLRSHERPYQLVFSGSMDWLPNEDAVVHFTRAILPLIRKEIPDVGLTIVGRNPSPAVKALAGYDRVQVTGTVDDVRPFVDEAALYVVPLRIGGGTRLKIFEALAMGKAVLSTTVGAEGLDVVPGVHAAIADGPDGFAREAISLLRNPTRRQELGRAGRQLVEERYSWRQVTGEFERHLAAVADVEVNHGEAAYRAAVS